MWPNRLNPALPQPWMVCGAMGQDVMSRRMRGRSVISGELLYDGLPPTMKKIKSETAYVQQQVCALGPVL
jgi:hypothetical protein